MCWNNRKREAYLKKKISLLQLKSLWETEQRNKETANERKVRVIAAISWAKRKNHFRRMATFLASLLLLLLWFTLVKHWYKANSLLYGFCSTVSIAPWSNASRTSRTMTREKSYCHYSLDPLLWKTLRENRLITWQAAHSEKKKNKNQKNVPVCTEGLCTAYQKWITLPSRSLKQASRNKMYSFLFLFSAARHESVLWQ